MQQLSSEKWNRIRVDLSSVDLRSADLSDCDLGWAWLTDADLRYAILDRVNLEGARLVRTHLFNTRTFVLLGSLDRTLIKDITADEGAVGPLLSGPAGLDSLRAHAEEGR